MFSFIVVVFLLFLVPGPAVINTISQTIKSGRTNGIMTDFSPSNSRIDGDMN
jgi:threonine/homoserine/homoserine lactone efflux protein